MARPTKQEYFPKWNPQNHTWNRINSLNKKDAIKALRNSSGGFIKNTHVRLAILKKCDYKCVVCGSKDNLQVDHIISVYLASKFRFLLDILNTKENLQILCNSCNASKSPEEGQWLVRQNRG